MNQSVNISKITPPYLSKILYRPRLVNLIKENKDKKLILILGQAAQGKTTLAASYGKTSDMPFAWVSLDKDESDPTSLFHLTVQSLQQALRDVDFSHLLSPYPPQIAAPRDEIPVYRGWAQSIFKEVSVPVQIVLDGLDRLSAAAPGFKFLQVLIEDSPSNVHLILLSREIPPPFLEFQHLKIRQQALVLTNEDLAFTRDEIKEYFQKVRGIAFDAGQLKKIHSATDGWIGALVLFAEFLGRFQESTMGKFISEDFPDHFKKEIFQYFGKEIFSSLSEQVQNFLIRSSPINLIEPAFIRDFLGMERAEEILREHTRKNLFVHSFYDEKKGWLFQYHHLFRDFLKAKFVTSIGPEEQKSLHLKAGMLYEQRGELENSVKHFLEANAYPQAASVVARLGLDLLQKGRIGDLSKWLLSLPNGTVQSNPWLLFYLAMTRRFIGGRENLIALQKAHAQFKQQGDIRGTLISLAQLMATSIQTGIHLTPIENLIEEGEAVLHQSESNEYPYEKAVLWSFVGLGRILGEGDIRKGIWACQNAYSIARQLRNISLQAYALGFSALGFVLLGEFSLAEEAGNKIEKIIEKGVYAEFKAVQLMVQCLLANHQGDFGKAKSLVGRLQGEIEKYGMVHTIPWAYEISGYLRAAQGEFSEAEKIAKDYLSAAISLSNGLFRGMAFKLLGLIYLYQNDFEKAREAIDQSMDAFSNEGPSKYHLHRARLQMALVCTHLKEFSRAEKELGEAYHYFSSISSYISLIEVYFAYAFLYWDQGKKDEATSHLRNGFGIAEARRYGHLPALGTKYLVRACLLALKLKVSGAMDYAAHLLSTRLSSLAEEDLKQLSNHPDSGVRERVWEIRKKIHRSKAPPLRIQTLGAFRVFRGGSLMGEDEWNRSQPKKLLKTILSYGGERIPKEIIIDELWPEESPRVAEKNFKTALQRLRKSLEPFMDKEFGSSYVHLHDNIVFLDAELCHVDADRFLSLLKAAEERQKKGDGKEAFPLYAEALEIYKGDFLPEELYAPWPDKKREELRAKYIELLKKMASLHERQGSLKKAIDCYKKAVQVDPLIEEWYQKLMTFYSNKGMYNEALKIYEECKKALKRELRTQPDSTTTAIYRKVLEKVKVPRTPPQRALGDRKNVGSKR